jgi:hypothetical protein
MSYILKASILIGAAILIAASTVPNPAQLFANLTASFEDLTASLADNLRLQPHTDQSTPITQSAADAETLMPVDKEPQTRNETPAPKPADQSQAPPPEQNDALFEQFQAWAAAQPNAALVPVVQDTPANVVQSAPTRENPRAPILTESEKGD